jgi:lysozyme
MRHASEDGLRLIRRFEGFSAVPYLCPAGYLTVGYGHVVKNPDAFRQPITEDEATEILTVDVEMAERAVLRLISVPLTDGQFDALVSFTFNLGAGALQRSTLRRKVNREDHEDAAAEFLRWVWAGGRKLNGLIRRRQAEAALYQS